MIFYFIPPSSRRWVFSFNVCCGLGDHSPIFIFLPNFDFFLSEGEGGMAFSLWRSDHGVLFFVFPSPLLSHLIPWADRWHGKRERK